MSSIILGGGRSSRLGQDKILMTVAGDHLLERTVRKLSEINDELILVLAQNQQNPVSQSFPKVKTAIDFQSGKGPLIGIYSGMKISNDNHCITVACDMPFLNIELLRYMTNMASEFDAVIPLIRGEVEPLHAIYSKSCLKIIENMIENNDLKVRNLLNQVKVRYIEETEIRTFDPEYLSWFNINTPDDLRKAEFLMNREKTHDPS